jgi:hypothetical protein
LLSILWVVLLAPLTVYVTVHNPVPETNSLSIAKRSWSDDKREGSG